MPFSSHHDDAPARPDDGVGAGPGSPTQLERRLTLGDATVIGVGSMLGAGVFVAFGPATAHAGEWLLAAVALAGVIAWCNATSTAQLAARYPSSGGTYVYATERLGAWAGFTAGWCFVSGKTASAAAMAMTVGLYAAQAAAAWIPGLDHGTWARAVAVVAILGVTAVNLGGVTKTAAMTRWLVALVLVVLFAVALALVLGLAGSGPFPFAPEAGTAPEPSPAGVASAAGLMFFAFAGYARIATMGEEVKDPQRSIPRAILVGLAFVLVLYLLLAGLLLATLGPAQLAATDTALLSALEASLGASGVPESARSVAAAVVVAGSAAGALGALLALIAGISRTALAMARRRDLPSYLTAVSSRSVPWASELTTAVLVLALILLTDVHTVIAFSSFGVLLYYALANLSALTMTQRPRWAPRAVNALGLLGCLVLAFALPWTAVATMFTVIAVGLLGRIVFRAIIRAS